MPKPILINSKYFEDEFVPSRFISREHQTKEILNILDPKRDRTTRTILIKGSSGTGKTCIVKHILKQKFPNNSVYVNCMSRYTPHKILEGILSELGCMVHGKEPMTDLLRKLSKTKRQVICLDDAQYIKEIRILCDIAQHCYSMILISNSDAFLAREDEGIISKLHLREVEFKRYSDDELLSIIKERIENGLRSDAIDPVLLNHISNICNGNARMALSVVRDSAEYSEEDHKSVITIGEVRRASKMFSNYRRQLLVDKLNDKEKVLYDIVRQNVEIDSAKLFLEFQKKIGDSITDRTYRNYMKHLCEIDLVEEKGIKRWKKFRIIN